MKQSKTKLQEAFEDFIAQSAIDNKEYSKIINVLFDKYNIPLDLSSDILTLRIQVCDQNDFVLYCILREIENSSIFKEKYSVLKVSDWFTKDEVKIYSKSKYEIEQIKFPLRFKMIAIGSNQWIGSIDVKTLMQIRDAGLIHYNENTQRPLRKITNKGVEMWQIAINRQQVADITKAFEQETYIPNTITLNMPEEAGYSYKEGVLTVKDIEYFDIIDGYHRYVAMSNIYNMNKKFDYPMELRIVCFDESRSQQFIWQEDQKTKMSKIDSESFNQDNPANQVVQALNEKQPLRGLITRNRSIIDASYMAQVVGILFFKNNKATNKDIIQVKNLLYKKFSELFELDTEIFDVKWDRKYLTAFLFVCTKEVDNILVVTNKLYSSLCSKENLEVINTDIRFRQNHVSRIEKLYKRL